MKKITLSTSLIPIECDKSNKSKANELKEIIEKNPNLFSMIFSGYTKISICNGKISQPSEGEVLYISSDKDIRYSINKIIKKYFNPYLNGEANQLFSISQFMIAALILLTSKESLETGEIQLKELDPEIKEELTFPIYEKIAYFYLAEKGELDKLLDYVLDLTAERKAELLTWINTPSNRIKLLNHSLEARLTSLSETDEFLYQNLAEIDSRLMKDTIKCVQVCQGDNEPFQFTKMNKEQLDTLFQEFLVKIDPSLKLLETYLNLKNRNKIIYCPGKNKQKEWHVNYKDSNPNCSYIVAYSEGTTNDFRNLAHVFAHYITYSSCEQSESIPTTLKEFASISFETIALGFLHTKGYREEEIKALRKERFHDVIAKMLGIYPMFNNLETFKKCGPITYQGLKATISSKMPELTNNTNSFDSSALPEIDDIIDMKINQANKELIIYYQEYLKGYSHVIGNYLATKAIQRIEEDDTMIPFIIDMTYSPLSSSIQQIFRKLGIATEGLTFSEPTTPKKRNYQN